MQNCIKCSKALPDGAEFCCWCGTNQSKSTHNHKRRGNGQGSVFKKPCGTWRAEYVKGYVNVDGKIKRVTKTKSGFKTKREALDYLEILKNENFKATTKKIHEIYDIIYERDIQELSVTKISHYKTAYKRLSDIMLINISDLYLEDIQAVIDSIDGGYYPKRDVKNLLSKIFEYAVINDYCSKNLAKYIKLPKIENTEKAIYTPNEINQLWESWQSGIEIAGYLLIMIYSGIRTGELRNIKIENVDIEKQIMYGGIKTEKGKRRPILIINKIKSIVDYFTNKNNDMLCNLSEYMFYKEFNKLKSELSFRDELTPNCSRHTCATALAEANVPPAIIMDILGHEKYDTSLNYTHVETETLLKSLEKAMQ